jgi:hypothetical protein
MKKILSAVLVLSFLLPTALASGTEVRVVRFFVPYELGAPPPCVPRTGWSSETVFHNTTDTEKIVRFLGVSNGTARSDARSLILAPHKTVAIRGSDQFLHWDPADFTPLWVDDLDVPDGVIVANRVESNIFQPDNADPLHMPCTGKEIDYGGLPLPVVKSPVAAGVPQYFLGTDVGGKNGLEVTDARLNIGIYNAGGAPANAQVRIYCSSLAALAGGPTDVLLQSDHFEVPPNAIVQKTVLASTTASKCPDSGAALWHAIVTVDQPSFAYAIGLANGTLPTFPGTVALTYTAN